jgi:AcrR family transcriptional regulator
VKRPRASAEAIGLVAVSGLHAQANGLNRGTPEDSIMAMESPASAIRRALKPRATETVSPRLPTPKWRQRRARRYNDPDATRRDIIETATREFAEYGLSGARIDRIATKTRTSKRMIYYYFGGKERLYLAVLEATYKSMRSVDAALDVSALPARQALAELVGTIFDHHEQHPEQVRLISIENIHRGIHLAKLKNIRQLHARAIEILRSILAEGAKEGVFRKGIDPVDLHLTITALCFYNVSNRYTYSTLFNTELKSKKTPGARRKSIIDTVIAAVRS